MSRAKRSLVSGKQNKKKNRREKFKEVQDITRLASLLIDTTKPFNKSDGSCTILEEAKFKLQRDLHTSVRDTLNQGKKLLESGSLDAISYFDRLINLTSELSRCSISEELKPMLSEAHHWRGMIELSKLKHGEDPSKEILRLFRKAVKLDKSNKQSHGQLRLCENPKSLGFQWERSRLKYDYKTRHVNSVY